MKTFKAQNIDSKLPIVKKVHKVRELCKKCGFPTEFNIKIEGNELQTVSLRLVLICETDLKGRKLSSKCNGKMIHTAIVKLPRAK